MLLLLLSYSTTESREFLMFGAPEFWTLPEDGIRVPQEWGMERKLGTFRLTKKSASAPPAPGPFNVKGVSPGKKSNKSNPTVYIDSESRIQTLL